MGYSPQREIIDSEAEAVRGMFAAVERGNYMRDIAHALSGSDMPDLPLIPTTPRYMHMVVTEKNRRRLEQGQEPSPVPAAQPRVYTSLHST